jgi:beta-glucanase (GH16 family)
MALVQRLLFLIILYVLPDPSFHGQHPPSWQLVWNDEFNYSGLPDSTKWSYDMGGEGWGNHELEFYTGKRLENARVEDGNLIIEARKEKWKGNNYTSARLVSKGKGDWKYGRIEIRAKIPGGIGAWPAIWMLSSKDSMVWPNDGEIDIMEAVGFDPGTIHASIHCKTYDRILGIPKTAVIKVPDADRVFHVYRLTWDRDSIDISVDEKKYFNYTNTHDAYDSWPFDQPMHILLNIAVGGDWGGQKGIDNSIFPKKMLIDYVRVYQWR